MKKLTKILLTMVAIAVVANVFYIGKEFGNFKENENFIIGIMETGMGTESENSISGSIYGHDYVVTYHVENNNLVREFNWK